MQLTRSLAVVCAACCLLVAYTHLSLIGLAFLVCYLAWCGTCIATPQLTASYRHHRTLWVTASLLSGAVLVAQLAVQLLYAMHLLPSAGSSSSKWAPILMEALGLSDLSGAPAVEVLQVLLAPLVLLAAAAAEAAEARAALRLLASVEASNRAVSTTAAEAAGPVADAPALPPVRPQTTLGGAGTSVMSSTAAVDPDAMPAAAGPAGPNTSSRWPSKPTEQQQQQQQGPEQGVLPDASGIMYSGDAADGASILLPLSSGLKYSNEGIFLGLLLVPAVCLSPTLVNVPYLLILSWVVLRWSGGDTMWATPMQLLPMQAYCALQLAALYLHQLLVMLAVLPAVAEQWLQLVGLYGWLDMSSADQEQAVPSGLQMAHFAVLHVLCAVIGLNLSLVRQPLYQGLRRAHLQQQAQVRGDGQQMGSSSQRQQQARPTAGATPPAATDQHQQPPPPGVPAAADMDSLQEPLLSRSTSQSGDHSVIEIVPHPRVPGDSSGTLGIPHTVTPMESVLEDPLWMPSQQQQEQQQLSASPGPPGSSPRISLLRLSSMRDWQPLQQYLREVEPAAHSPHATGAGAAGLSAVGRGPQGAPAGTREAGLWAQLRLLSYVLLPILASFGELAVLGLTSAPATAAIAMAGFAMVQVSLLGGITLIAALSSLLMPGPSGKAALQRCSPPLALLYIAWLVLSYVATALAGIVSPPGLVKSLGLWGYTAPPPAVLPFLLQLMTAVVVSGLARNQAAAARGSARAPPAAAAVANGVQAAANRAGPRTQPPLSSTAPAAPTLADMLSSIALEEQQMLQAIRISLQTWSRSLGVGSVQLIWHLGQLVVPLSWGFLAATRPDILHGIYLLAMVVVLLTYNLWHIVPQLPRMPQWALHCLQQHYHVHREVADQADQQQQEASLPAAAAAGAGAAAAGHTMQLASADNIVAEGQALTGCQQQQQQEQHLANALPAAHNARYGLLRGYATAHLLVIYIALVLQLPGLKSDFNQRVLQLVGLLDPRIVTDLVPVLLVLLGATVEVALGKWLATHVVTCVPEQPAAGSSVPGHAAFSRDTCSSTTTAGQQRGSARGKGPLGEVASGNAAPTTTAAEAVEGRASDGPQVPEWLLQRVSYPRLFTALVNRAAGDGTIIDVTALAGCSPQDNPSAVLWWLQVVHQPILFGALTTVGRGALAAGVPALVLLGYLLLLVDTPPGLLGLAYLIMLLAVYLVPPSASGYLAYIQNWVQYSCRKQPTNTAAAAAGRPRRGTRQQQRQELQPLLGSYDAAQQPTSSRHSTANGGSEAAELPGQSMGAHGRLMGAASIEEARPWASGWVQWLAWLVMVLLSLLCAADLLTQYVLVVGAVVQDAPLLPPDWSHWVRDVVGIDDDATGRQLLLALLRPTLLLASQCVIKYFSAIGGAAAWHYAATTTPAAGAAMALQQQQGWQWLTKRCAIIHSGKLLAAAAFAAAMQLPSATGLGLLTLVVGRTWLTGGRAHVMRPGLSNTSRRRAAAAAKQISSAAALWATWLLQLVVAAWVLLLYMLQLPLLRGAILSSSPSYLPGLLGWLGLPLLSLEAAPADPVPGVRQPGVTWPYLDPSKGYTLSVLLQWKVLLLVAAALWKQSCGWLQQVPAELLVYHKGVAGSGPCPLFWPPAHLGRDRLTTSLRSSLALVAQQAARQLSLLVTVGTKLLQLVSATSARALRAMDINPGDIHLGIVGEDTLWPLLAKFGIVDPEQAVAQQDGPLAAQGLLSGYLLQLLQRAAYPLWHTWGMDVSLLLLVLVAFYSCTMLSLVYVLLVGLGMWLQPSASQPLWRVVVVPFLGVVLTWQYATYLGLPPLPAGGPPAGGDEAFAGGLHGSEPPAAPADVLLQHWLGAFYVQPATLWLLLAALWAAWVQSRQAGQAGAPGVDPDGVWAATMQTEAQAPAAASTAAAAAAAAPKPSTSMQSELGRPQLQDAAVQTCSPGYVSTWCQGSRSNWTAAEVVVYYLAWHSMDLLLVCVVVVCAVQRDITHAGYLALALIGFRHRQPQPAVPRPAQHPTAAAAGARAAAARRGADEVLPSANLLGWLQTFNYSVMAAMLLYQSPLELLMGPSWAVSCQLQTASHCTAPHLLGFCKLLQWEPVNATTSNSTAWAAPWQLQQQEPGLPGWHPAASPLPPAPTAAGGMEEAPSSRNSWWTDGFRAVSLLAISGSMADIVLWILLRLQLKLQQSRLYAHIRAVAAHEAQGSAAALQLQRQGWYYKQAAAALTTSRLKLARLLRINQLKEIMLEKGVVQAEGGHGQMVGEASWADVAAAAEAVSGLSPQPSMEYAEGLVAAQGAAEPVVVSEHPLAHDAEQQELEEGAAHASLVTSGYPAGMGGSHTRVGHHRRTYDGSGRASQGFSPQQQGSEQQRPVPAANPPHMAASSAASSGGSYHTRSASDPTGRWGSWSNNNAAQQQQPAPAELQLVDPRLTMLRSQEALGATIGASGGLTGSSPDLLGFEAATGVAPRSSSMTKTESSSGLLQLQAAAAGPGSTTSEPAPDQRLQPTWLTFFSSRTSRAAMCYALYILAFLYDYSLLTLVYPVSMLVWALLSQRRVFRYWKVMLVYTEVLLVAQYSFLTASKCLCIGSSGSSSSGGDSSPTGPGTSGDMGLSSPAGSSSSSGGGGSSGCVWLVGDAAFKHHLDLLGLHAAAGKDILLFLVYLATLTYHHHLSSYQPLSVEVLASRLAMEAPTRGETTSSAGAAAAGWRVRATAPAGSWTVLLQGWVSQLWRWLVRVLWKLGGHVRYIAWPHEQYPSWVLLELGQPPAGVDAWTSPQGAQLLQGGFQRALDALRSGDVAAAAAAAAAAPGTTPAAMSALAGFLGLEAVMDAAGRRTPLPGEQGATEDVPAAATATAGSGVQRSWSVESLAGLQQPSGMGGSAYDSQAADAMTGIDLSRYTRLLLRLDRVMLRQPSAAAQLPAATTGAAVGLTASPAAPPVQGGGTAGTATVRSSTAGSGMGGSAQPTPRASFIHSMPSSAFSTTPAARMGGLHMDPGLSPCAVALFEVVPEPQASARSAAEGALGPLLLSSSRPGRDAAAALVRLQEQQRCEGLVAAAKERLQQQAPPSSSSAAAAASMGTAAAAGLSADAAGWLPCSLLGVEHHSAAPRDYYTATAAIDVAAFIYAALFYQVVFSSARTLADITDEKQLPWDYLAVLICLFLCMVAARVFYSLGSQLGHFLLYCIQLVAFLTCTMSLYWSRPMEPAAHNHLRVFLGLKLASFCLAAQQLRCGFPPRASFTGGGRQQFLFFARADTWHMMGFYAFQAVPFLYELRVLLDWTAAATSLSWYQWLKLEDIRASLFLDEVRAAGRASRAPGERVPRWQKFLQGTLLFSLLLVAIWLPLLLFSSGAPTYQVPQLLDVRVAASIGVVTQYSSYAGVMNFPLFEVGMRHTTQNWHLLPGPPQPPANSSNSSVASTVRGLRPALHAHKQPAAAGSSSTYGSMGVSAPALRGGAAPAVQHSNWHHAPGQPLLRPQRSWLPSRLRPRQQQHQHSKLSRHASVGDGAGGEEGRLPYSLQGYTPDQVKLICLSQDSDVVWSITPPAKAALSAVLQEPAAALTLSWSLLRTAPLASSRGGPLCATDLTLPLAGESRRQLLEVLEGNRSSAQLRVLDPTDPRGWAPGHNGTAGVYSLFWRLRGEACAVRTRFEARPDSQGAGSAAEDAWLSQEVGCWLSLVSGEGQQEAQWWQFSCGLVSPDTPEPPMQGLSTPKTSSSLSSSSSAAAAQQSADAEGAAGASLLASSISGLGVRSLGQPITTSTAVRSSSSSSSSASSSSSSASTSQRLWGPSRRAASLRRLLLRSASAGAGAAAAVPAQAAGCGVQLADASCTPAGSNPLPTKGRVEAVPLTSSSSTASSPSSSTATADSGGDAAAPVLPPAVGCEEGFLGPPLVVVLERVQSGLLGAALSSIGITGLYISFVFGIGRFLRLTVSNIRLRIPYEDFPSTAALVALVQDIYIARAEGELALEEELFYLLLKIYKTPDLLQQLTRGKDRDKKEKQE